MKSKRLAQIATWPTSTLRRSAACFITGTVLPVDGGYLIS
jgi:hypothetical protein